MMIKAQFDGIGYVAIDTDKAALSNSKADTVICFKNKSVDRFDASGNIENGQVPTDECMRGIEHAVNDACVIIIVAGMGGDAGINVAPIVANLSLRPETLTIGIVTMPFSFEGKKRIGKATTSIEHMKKYVDSLVVIPSDRLALNAKEKTKAAFAILNEILIYAVSCITNFITESQAVSVWVDDLPYVFANGGIAYMSIGRGKGEDKVTEAVRSVMEAQLFETPISNAKAVWLNIDAGCNVRLNEVDEAMELIEHTFHNETTLGFTVTATPCREMPDEMKITLIATRFDEVASLGKDGMK
jgi:cell division protein FtsZ